jgi:hypothetical protein
VEATEETPMTAYLRRLDRALQLPPTPAPVDALVKAADGAILYLEALDSGGVHGPGYFAGQLRLALAAIREGRNG